MVTRGYSGRAVQEQAGSRRPIIRNGPRNLAQGEGISILEHGRQKSLFRFQQARKRMGMARGFGNVDATRLGATNNVVVAATSTAAASAAFRRQTYQFRVATSVVCFLKIGDGTASDAQLPLNRVEYFIVTSGQKISAFSRTTQTISVSEVTQ